MSDGIKERPLTTPTISGRMDPLRTVDVVARWRVTSPQSPTLLHQLALD